MLRARMGVGRAEELLISSSASDRLRGVDRLAALDTDEAVKALALATTPGSAVRTDARSRLAAVRALAPHTKDSVEVRRALFSVLNSVAAGGPETALDEMSRVTAALALAEAGSTTTLTPLIAAVIGRGRTGQLARDAVLAFPPKDIRPLLRNPKTISSALIELLGDLGDPRALGVLRKQLVRPSLTIQRAATVALAKLGDGTAIEHATKWAFDSAASSPDDAKPEKKSANEKDAKPEADEATPKDAEAIARNRIAGAEALMWLDAPKAATAIAQLLGDARTRSAGLHLAEQSLSPALVPTLSAVVAAKVTPAERVRATNILAKIGGDAAAGALLKLLAVPELATTAAFGLGSARGDVATDGLVRALAAAASGAPRRLVLRAALVRHLKLGIRIEGLVAALERELSSQDAADRAVGAWGLVLLGERSVGDLTKSKHPEVVIAATQAALALGHGALGAAGAVLKKGPEEPDATTVGAAAALAVGGHGLPTTRLLEWAEGGSSLGPLASLQLARRDSAPYRKRLVLLLEGTDPVVRQHVALGLAHSPEADAAALLADAYRFETDVRVRSAIVRALSQRKEKRRVATLKLAATLDPSPLVRGLAGAAVAGRKLALAEVPNGGEVAWISLRANSEGQRAATASRAAMLVRDDGLALPVVSAPDGVIIVPGIGDRERLSIVVDPLD